MSNEETTERDEDQVLDLAALTPERKQVRFTTDGELYEMVRPEELSIQERADVMGFHRLGERLNEKNNPDNDDFKRLNRALNKAFAIIMRDAPSGDLEDLPDFKKESVVLAFMNAFGDSMIRLAKASGDEHQAEALRNLTRKTPAS